MGLWADFKLKVFGTEDLSDFAKNFSGELGARTTKLATDAKTSAESILTLSSNDRVPLLGSLGDYYDSAKQNIFGTTDIGDFIVNFADEAKKEAKKDITGISQVTGDAVKNVTGGALGAIPTTVWVVLGFVLLFAVLFYIAPMRAKA